MFILFLPYLMNWHSYGVRTGRSTIRTSVLSKQGRHNRRSLLFARQSAVWSRHGVAASKQDLERRTCSSLPTSVFRCEVMVFHETPEKPSRDWLTQLASLFLYVRPEPL